jgi:hypothetical protein
MPTCHSLLLQVLRDALRLGDTVATESDCSADPSFRRLHARNSLWRAAAVVSAAAIGVVGANAASRFARHASRGKSHVANDININNNAIEAFKAAGDNQASSPDFLSSGYGFGLPSMLAACSAVATCGAAAILISLRARLSQ